MLFDGTRVGPSISRCSCKADWAFPQKCVSKGELERFPFFERRMTTLTASLGVVLPIKEKHASSLCVFLSKHFKIVYRERNAYSCKGFERSR